MVIIVLPQNIWSTPWESTMPTAFARAEFSLSTAPATLPSLVSRSVMVLPGLNLLRLSCAVGRTVNCVPLNTVMLLGALGEGSQAS